MNIENQRIKEWRSIIKLSIEEFSEKTGIAVERLRRIEEGRAKVTLKEIIAIGDAFHLSADYLLGHKEIPSPLITCEEEAILWAKLESLEPGQLEELIAELKRQGEWEE